MRPMPDGFKELRPHQVKAIDEILEAFEDNDVVFLDAPTGSGKTLIGERVAAAMDARAVYICTDLSLQAQFMRDFPDAKNIMGKSNYPGQHQGTADLCTGEGPEKKGCMNCDGAAKCPYIIAKRAAVKSELAVTNTAFFLNEVNYAGQLRDRDLVICDEGDMLEGMLMGFVKFEAVQKHLAETGLVAPKKGAHKKTLLKWADEYGKALEKLFASCDIRTETKRYKSLASEIGNVRQLHDALVNDMATAQGNSDGEGEGIWLRKYDERARGEHFQMSPVVVSQHGEKNLWKWGRKWLVMSASIISADEMADSLGITANYTTVKVEMTFPVENRPIIMAPVAFPTYKTMGVELPKLAYAINQIAEREDGRILVHCHSYRLTQDLVDRYKGDRHVVTYASAKDREAALARYKEHPDSIMFASSMDRGIDLPNDMCRTQIIAKVPYAHMGDAVVKQRVYGPGGNMWYNVNAIRSIVQMTGRAVRNDKDWADTYIIDGAFARNIWGKWKNLFPDWWRESVDTSSDVRWLMKP